MKKHLGFTLIEFSMVIVLLAIFASISAFYLRESFHAAQQSDKQLELTLQASDALARLNRELLQAFKITALGNNNITFTDYLNNTVTYQLSANQMIRQENANPSQVLVAQVSSLNFNYYQGDLSTALLSDEVYFVAINLILSNSEQNFQLNSVIHPRLA